MPGQPEGLWHMDGARRGPRSPSGPPSLNVPSINCLEPEWTWTQAEAQRRSAQQRLRCVQDSPKSSGQPARAHCCTGQQCGLVIPTLAGWGPRLASRE